MVNTQEYLNQNYPVSERGSITELNIKGENLERELDLSDFVNLEKLDCSSNQLTILNLNKNVKLSELRFVSNQLTSIDLSANINLEIVKAYDNNISADLSVFSHLVNLIVKYKSLRKLSEILTLKR